MTRDQITLITRGEQKVREARRIAQECPVGFLVVHDLDGDRVYYKDTNSPSEIETNFTAEHVEIAHRDFLPGDPDFLQWDMLNSTAAGSRFNVYKVEGK